MSGRQQVSDVAGGLRIDIELYRKTDVRYAHRSLCYPVVLPYCHPVSMLIRDLRFIHLYAEAECRKSR